DSFERIDHLIEPLVVYGRPRLRRGVQAALLVQRLTTADLAGEPSPAKRAPDESADVLVDAERHQLPFVVPADEGVVDLVGDVARPTVPVGNGQRLHEMPAGEVG